MENPELESQPRPLECLHEARIPPFLSKTFDIVNDPVLDGIISWAPPGNSFVIWNPPQFERAVLPTHFKHANFSSFVRQLNTYGFRKISADRWEFANEEFLRGSKHLLKNINRRRSQGGPQIGYNSLEITKYPNMEAEVHNLRRDKNMLQEEVSRLQQEQVITLQHLNSLNEKMESAEQRQKQMVSFFAKIMQNPAFTACLKTHQEQRMRRKFLKHQKSNLGQSSSSQQHVLQEKELKLDVEASIEEPVYSETPIIPLSELEPDASTRVCSLKGKDVVQTASEVSDLPASGYIIMEEPWSPTQQDLLNNPSWDLELQLDAFEDFSLFNVDPQN